MAQYNAGFSVGQEQSGFSTTATVQQQQETRYTMQEQRQFETMQSYDNDPSFGYDNGTLGQQSMIGVDLEARYETGTRQQRLASAGSGFERYEDTMDARQLQLDSDAALRNSDGGYTMQQNSRYDVQYGGGQQVQMGYQESAGTILNKQEFEARKSRSKQQGGQFVNSWRNAKDTGFVARYQPGSQSAKTEEAEASSPQMTEDQYREWLTVNFKHRFEPFERLGGMPLDDFHKMVEASDLKRTQNLKSLFAQLDKDGNNRVSWQEFYTGMKYTKKDEVPRRRKAVNSFINAMTPVAKKQIKKQKEQAAADGEPIPEESYLEAYNCRPPPLFIPLFYVAVWIFFIIYAVELQKGPEWNRVGWEKGFPFQSPLVFCPSVREQVWRFVSYSLLHDGYHHVIFNTIFSLLLGLPLECVHKAWRVGPVFMMGVIFGSLASSIADPGTPLIGASGGVYALIGAHYALIVMNWEELQDDWTNIRRQPLRFLLSGVMRLVYLTILVIIDFGLAFYRRYSGTTTLPTSAVAHIGGLLAGLFSGVPILRNIEKKPWEGIAFIVSIVICVLMFLFGVFWNIFSRNFPAPNATPCSNPSLLLVGK